MRYAALLLLFWSLPALAQESKTDPFEMPHPETGETGVWVPQWAQKLELERRVDLRVCTETKAQLAEALDERKLETKSLRAEQDETAAANERLKEQLTVEKLRRQREASRAETNKVIAWTSAGGGGVAVLVAILLSIL